jgi:hypothetical protein
MMLLFLILFCCLDSRLSNRRPAIRESVACQCMTTTHELIGYDYLPRCTRCLQVTIVLSLMQLFRAVFMMLLFLIFCCCLDSRLSNRRPALAPRSDQMRFPPGIILVSCCICFLLLFLMVVCCFFADRRSQQKHSESCSRQVLRAVLRLGLRC